MSINGRKFDPNNPQMVALANRIGVAPQTGGGGKGVNYQAFKILHGPDGYDRLYYLERDLEGDFEANPVPVRGAAPASMSDAQRRQTTLQLAQLNLRRAEDNLPPRSFDDFIAAGGGAQAAPPAAAPPPAQPLPTYNPPPAKKLPGYNPQPKATAPTPAPNPTPGLSVVPGAKPEKVTSQKYGRGGGHRGSYHRGGGGSGSGSEKDAGFQIDGINKANNMAADSEERAARLARDGYDDEAEAEKKKAARYRQAGDQIRARARRNPHVTLNEDGSAEAAGAKPKVKLPSKFAFRW